MNSLLFFVEKVTCLAGCDGSPLLDFDSAQLEMNFAEALKMYLRHIIDVTVVEFVFYILK